MQFNGILKPGFNSLDMSEVEQEDVPDPRNLSQAMQNVSGVTQSDPFTDPLQCSPRIQ